MDIHLNRPQMGPGMGPRLSKILIVPGVICMALAVLIFVEPQLLRWMVAGLFGFVGLLLVLLGLRVRSGFPGMPPGMM